MTPDKWRFMFFFFVEATLPMMCGGGQKQGKETHITNTDIIGNQFATGVE